MMTVPTTRDAAQAAGRLVTRALLRPQWRNHALVKTTYLRLYLLGKRLTGRHGLGAIRSLLSPGMVVADIGANVGFYTFEMAAAVGPAGRVIAFEPDPFSADLLEARKARAGAENVEV